MTRVNIQQPIKTQYFPTSCITEFHATFILRRRGYKATSKNLTLEGKQGEGGVKYNPKKLDIMYMSQSVYEISPYIQWCAYKSAALLFQDSGKTIHSAEKNDTSYKWAGFFTDMKQKKIQNVRLKKFKMAASKKPHFPAPPILNIFS